MQNNKIGEGFSLLFPEGYEKVNMDASLSECSNAMKDLGLFDVFSNINFSPRHDSKLRSIYSQITDNKNIIQYRLDIIEDFLNNSDMAVMFEELIPMLDELVNYNKVDTMGNDPIDHINKLQELELYVECIKKLHNFFANIQTRINSQGIKNLMSIVEKVALSQSFNTLKDNILEMKAGFTQIASITVGINLDAQLRPEKALLVSVNDKKYKSGDLLDRLLSLDFTKDKYHGISPLEPVVKGSGTEAEIQRNTLQGSLNECLNSIFRSSVRSFAPTIKKYKNENTRFLGVLGDELFFYLGAIKLINTMEAAGLPMCKPKIAAMEERICKINDIYNIKLALQMRSKYPEESLKELIVLNEVEFDESGRIFILTGPNQGGKTTFIQAVGITQFLFQLGLYVPANYAHMSPVDIIYTHFPVEEKDTTFMGRLGEECSRLNHMFKKISSHSLVLLNESLTSTSPGEGAYIAKEIMLGLKHISCRGIYATHFHELASNLEATNKLVSGDSRIESLVAGVDGLKDDLEFNKRSYKIARSLPKGNSYAKDIAVKYGISLENIMEVTSKRG